MKFDEHRNSADGQAGRSPFGGAFSLTAALAWGLMFPIAAGTLEHIDPVNLTLLRYVGASALFLAALWLVEGRSALRYEGRFLQLWWLGTLGFAGFNLLAFLALNYTEPQNAALIVATAPAVTILLHWLRDGTRPAPVILGLVAVAFVGVAMVLGKGNPLTLATHANAGDLLVLGGVVGWVLYSLGAADHSDLSPLRYTALTAPAGLLSIAAIVAVTDTAGWTTVPSTADVAAEWPSVFYVIAVGAFVGVLSWNEGVRRLGPSTGALFMNMVPVTSFAVAIAQGYAAAPGELAGAALTIAAIVAANRLASRRAPTRASTPAERELEPRRAQAARAAGATARARAREVDLAGGDVRGDGIGDVVVPARRADGLTRTG